MPRPDLKDIKRMSSASRSPRFPVAKVTCCSQVHLDLVLDLQLSDFSDRVDSSLLPSEQDTAVGGVVLHSSVHLTFCLCDVS